MIQMLVSICAATLAFIVSQIFNKFFFNINSNTIYAKKTNMRNKVYLLFYLFIFIISILVSRYINEINILLYAFSIKALYNSLAMILRNVYSILPEKVKDKNKDFAYMDSIMMVNLIAVVIIATVYGFFDYLGWFSPYSGRIGNMIFLIALLSLIFDSFNLYCEYERKNVGSLICKIEEKKWNLIDKIYLYFYLIKTFLKNRCILLLFFVYILMYIALFLKNSNRI